MGESIPIFIQERGHSVLLLDMQDGLVNRPSPMPRSKYHSGM